MPEEVRASAVGRNAMERRAFQRIVGEHGDVMAAVDESPRDADLGRNRAAGVGQYEQVGANGVAHTRHGTPDEGSRHPCWR